jgi:GT2 family glycosyltransferase
VIYRAPLDNHRADNGEHDTTDCGKSADPMVSVVIVNTNERHHLARCLPTVLRQSYPSFEMIVVDNNSSDGSQQFIAESFPDVVLVHSKENLGYPGANNLGFEHAQGSLLAVLNPDTEVHPSWLEHLVAGLLSNPDAGLATSRILLMSDRTRVNACGNHISLSGLTFCRGVNRPAEDFDEPATVSAVSGASFVIWRSVVDEIGPFDHEFVSYLEETDLSLRAALAGYTSIYVPGSIAWHDYEFRFNARKCFHIEKNRLYMLLKALRLRTLLLLTPVLLLTELMVWAYVLTCGRSHISAKANSYAWLVRNRSVIRVRRAEAQRVRRIPDRELISMFVSWLPFEQTVGGVVGRTMNRVISSVFGVISQLPLRFAD